MIERQIEVARMKEEEEARKKETKLLKEKQWKEIRLQRFVISFILFCSHSVFLDLFIPFSQTEQWKKLDHENQEYFALLDQEMKLRNPSAK